MTCCSWHRYRVSEMSLGPVDLSAEVADIAGELQSGEPGRRVRFAIQDGVWVNADRTLIRTVLQNLVENAWKYTVQARRRHHRVRHHHCRGRQSLLLRA